MAKSNAPSNDAPSDPNGQPPPEAGDGDSAPAAAGKAPPKKDVLASKEYDGYTVYVLRDGKKVRVARK